MNDLAAVGGGGSSTAGPDVAVVAVNFGSSTLLARNVVAPPDVQVVVVDNRSTDAEREAIRLLATERGWDLVERPDNLGFGVGMNTGVARARELGAQVVALVNPDARLEPDALAALVAHVRARPGDVVAPRVVTSGGYVEFQGSTVSLADGRIRGLRHLAPDADGWLVVSGWDPSGVVRGWLGGACLVLAVEVFDRIGGFDEDYFLYWEDVDFSLRAEDAGARLVVRADVTVVHDEGGTQGERQGRAKSATYYRWNCRNRLRFAARHVPRGARRHWVRSTPAVSAEIWLRGGRRQLLHSPGTVLAAARGSLEGLALLARTAR